MVCHTKPAVQVQSRTQNDAGPLHPLFYPHAERAQTEGLLKPLPEHLRGRGRWDYMQQQGALQNKSSSL